MGPYSIEGDTTEIRLLRSIVELSGRIMMAQTSEQREFLRHRGEGIRGQVP